MAKLEKFYESLMNHETTAKNGDLGYLVTVGELLENGGRDEFFRTVRRHKDGSFSVSRNVYQGIEWDRENRAYYAGCFTDYCHNSPDLKKSTIVFIGFDF